MSHHHPAQPGGAPARQKPHFPTAYVAQGLRTPGYLNVIFHGLFVFVDEGKDDIDVLIPNVGSEHVYRAGAWLGEVTLAKRPARSPYRLLGVDRGQGRFERARNLAMKKLPNRTARLLYATLRMPRPKKIFSHGLINFPRGGVTIENTSVNQAATLQTFAYDFTDLLSVELTHHQWIPQFDDPTARYVNLHLFAEPEGPMLAGHRQHVVDVLNKLTPEADLVYEPAATRARSDPPPPGTIEQEFEDLAGRMDRFAQAARDARAGNARVQAVQLTASGPDGRTCWDVLSIGD